MTTAGQNAARPDTVAPRQREGPPARGPAAWPALAVAVALAAVGAVFVAAPAALDPARLGCRARHNGADTAGDAPFLLVARGSASLGHLPPRLASAGVIAAAAACLLRRA